MLDKISDREIEEARRVLSDHTVKHLTRESALEAGIFCITSQATPWEKATEIVHCLRERSYNCADARNFYSSWDVLSDKNAVQRVIEEKGWRFAHDRRCDELIDYASRQEGRWWEEILNAGSEDREKYSAENGSQSIRWVSRKTFSFWNICLGGRDLIALDVHILRNLSKLGVEIGKGYFVPVQRGVRKVDIVTLEARARKELDAEKGMLFSPAQFAPAYAQTLFGERKGQKVRKTPDRDDYLRIEREAVSLFGSDPRFLYNGKVDLALVDAVLWWRGARGQRRDAPCLIGEPEATRTSQLPYSNHVRPAQ